MLKPASLCLFSCLLPALAVAAALPGANEFHKQVQPVLQQYCFDCHGDGAHKGNVAFDEFKSDQAVLGDHELWAKALKMLRAGLMPPAKKARPNSEQREEIVRWIKRGVLGLDPQNPDPGRVTVRRLNRVEYHNTILDLLGVNFDATGQFPPDDTGYGFDNIGDVLTLPPMLLEKYLVAANQVIGRATPERLFPEPVPAEAEGKRLYARRVLRGFATRAFRRPVDEETVDRLVHLAESTSAPGGKTFREGLAEAYVAVLASPRFLFREEEIEPGSERKPYPLIDEYSLASRLSYFLWSSMPDDELLHLAGDQGLRKNLTAQTTRMFSDARSRAFIGNFAGQWLRTRDIESIPIESRFVLAREEKFDPQLDRNRKRFRELRDIPEEKLTPDEKDELAKMRATFRQRQSRPARVELNGELRRAMRQETERVFARVMREDRPLLELLDSDYTFLNGPLARLYGITNVVGEEMRLVQLPPNSPRGGVLTEGTLLVTTSNPTRTSPVKRGAFILDSILGMPVPPPPPNLPPLEDAAKKMGDRPPTLRETLAVHRESPLCSSCHNRMDPLGLAFENFNAMGMWRESEFGESIEAGGQLITGEPFNSIHDLKQILVKNHAEDFYRTLTEKLLTYALGRGLEDYDIETVDQIVHRIEKSGGRSSALLAGVIESAPFQKARKPAT